MRFTINNSQIEEAVNEYIELVNIDEIDDMDLTQLMAEQKIK